MSVLRVFCPLEQPAQRCAWVLFDAGRPPLQGESPLSELPRRVSRVELVLPATQVVMTRTQVPPAARRRGGNTLAFAVEDGILGDADATAAMWIGRSRERDVVARVDRQALERWLQALATLGFRTIDIHAETLLLPMANGEWSVGWNGEDAFVRTGRLEGAALDCGGEVSPPLGLRLMLEEAAAQNARPQSVALFTVDGARPPDVDAWGDALGVRVRAAGEWDWRQSSAGASDPLMRRQRRWHLSPALTRKLRPAAWMTGAALALNLVALSVDCARLALEERALRSAMETRFRSAFPEAVAVADPALQMRRKLAHARHAAAIADPADLLPMLQLADNATAGLPAGALRAVGYDQGRLVLELAGLDDRAVARVAARFREADTLVDVPRRGGAALQTIVVRAR